MILEIEVEMTLFRLSEFLLLNRGIQEEGNHLPRYPSESLQRATAQELLQKETRRI